MNSSSTVLILRSQEVTIYTYFVDREGFVAYIMRASIYRCQASFSPLGNDDRLRGQLLRGISLFNLLAVQHLRTLPI